MLIDISDVLQINVFALGAVFLQMCHILHLENQPMFFRQVMFLISLFTDALSTKNVFSA